MGSEKVTSDWEHRTHVGQLELDVLEASKYFVSLLNDRGFPEGWAYIRAGSNGAALSVGIESIRDGVKSNYCVSLISENYKGRKGFMEGTTIPHDIATEYEAFLRKTVPNIYFIKDDFPR